MRARAALLEHPEVRLLRPQPRSPHQVVPTVLITVLAAARSALRTRGALALENLALRQQLAVLRRSRPRPPLDWVDRLFWVALSRAWSRWRNVLIIVKPATVDGELLKLGVGISEREVSRVMPRVSRRLRPGAPS